MPEGDVQIVDTINQEVVDEAGGVRCSLNGLLFSDGTNLFVVSWPGGARLARTAAVTGWAMEERYKGRVPRRYTAVVDVAWKTVSDAMAGSGKAARDWMADPKCAGCEKALDLDADEVWFIDFFCHCESCGPSAAGRDGLEEIAPRVFKSEAVSKALGSR
jgi:hypothetical protein